MEEPSQEDVFCVSLAQVKSRLARMASLFLIVYGKLESAAGMYVGAPSSALAISELESDGRA